MIFASKNESGEAAWELVLSGRKTVTRRMRPVPVGAVRSIQPGRTKKGVGSIEILSCVPHLDWQIEYVAGTCDTQEALNRLTKEAQAEGFIGWQGLLKYFDDHGLRIEDTYRIEFRLVKGGDGNGL